MAAPAQINTLRATDFPKGLASRGAVEKLFQILNPFLQQAGSVTSKGTALGQNIDGQFATLELQTPASDWTLVPAFTNGWGAGVPAPSYRRDAAGNVWLRGRVTGGTAATSAFTLPAVYRPSQVFRSLAANVTSTLDIGTDGTVVPGNTATFILDGIVYAEAVNTPGVLPCFPVLVRLKDGKKPTAVIAYATDVQAKKILPSLTPGWTYQGPGATGNLLRIDNLPGLVLGRSYSVSVFVFF